MTESAARSAGVLVGVDLSRVETDGAPSLDVRLTRVVALGADTLGLGAGSLEQYLGAPIAPASAHPLPADSFELGLTHLEEEVLQDEIAEARAAFEAVLGRWRAGVGLTRLEALRQRGAAAGIGLSTVAWSDLARWTDDEIDYAFRVTKAMGARVVAVPMTLGAPRRLSPFADRHALKLGLEGQFATGPADFEVAMHHGALVGVAIDTADWTAGRHGPLLPFLETHAGRITHLCLRDCTADGDAAPLGQGVAPVREALQAMRDRGWSFPALVAADSCDVGAGAGDGVAEALAFCRLCLVP